MAGQSAADLAIYEQRLRLLQRHRQEWRDLSASLAISRHELHEQHRQQRRQLINATVQEHQVLLRQQVDRLWERQQVNQALRDQLRAKQKGEWIALNTPSNRPPEWY